MQHFKIFSHLNKKHHNNRGDGMYYWQSLQIFKKMAILTMHKLLKELAKGKNTFEP